jgi:hypothetical protein
MRLQTVHLRVNDAATGQPTPCRVRLTDDRGRQYAPFGQSVEFSTRRGEDVGGHVSIGHHRWFTMDGSCEMRLPPGEIRVQVVKGLEYAPIDRVINQPAGKMSIRLAIERKCPAVDCTLDARCHFLTPHAALLDAAAEGLSVVNLLAEPLQALGSDGRTYTSVPNLEAFSGQTSCLEKFGTRVIVNTHHRHRVLGSLGLLHCHRMVHPLAFGPPDETDDWSLADWAGQCHRKGGLVIWTEPFSPKTPFAGEALALAVLREIDAYEISPDFRSESLTGWYRLLNAGIVLPLVGSSGRVANDRPLGALQTMTDTLDDDWVGMIKTGSGRVTNGPIPVVTIDGRRVHAAVGCLTPFDRLELMVNGAVVARGACGPRTTDPGGFVATLEHELTEPGWVAARAVGTSRSALDGRSSIFAHTSARVFGELRRDAAAVAYLRDHLQRSREWVAAEGRFEQERFRNQLLATLDAATARLANP